MQTDTPECTYDPQLAKLICEVRRMPMDPLQSVGSPGAVVPYLY